MNTQLDRSDQPSVDFSKLSKQARQIYYMRQQNDKLRKEISGNLSQIVNLTNKTHQTKQNQQKLSILLDQPSIQRLLVTFNGLANHVQEVLYQQDSKQVQHKASIYKFTEQLQFVTIQNDDKSRIIEQIKQRKKQLLNSLSQQIEKLEQLNNSLQQLELKDNQKSLKQINRQQKMIQLQQNFTLQKDYINQLIKQRAHSRIKSIYIRRALQILKTKVQNHTQEFTQFENRSQRNSYLTQENKRLQTQLLNQTKQYQVLQNIKLDDILQRQIRLATDMVQKWNQPKKESQSLLLNVLAKINQKIPSRKLQDVGLIIKEAEEHYKNVQKSQRVPRDNYEHSNEGAHNQRRNQINQEERQSQANKNNNSNKSPINRMNNEDLQI